MEASMYLRSFQWLYLRFRTFSGYPNPVLNTWYHFHNYIQFCL